MGLRPAEGLLDSLLFATTIRSILIKTLSGELRRSVVANRSDTYAPPWPVAVINAGWPTPRKSRYLRVPAQGVGRSGAPAPRVSWQGSLWSKY